MNRIAPIIYEILTLECPKAKIPPVRVGNTAVWLLGRGAKAKLRLTANGQTWEPCEEDIPTIKEAFRMWQEHLHPTKEREPVTELIIYLWRCA